MSKLLPPATIRLATVEDIPFMGYMDDYALNAGVPLEQWCRSPNNEEYIGAVAAGSAVVAELGDWRVAAGWYEAECSSSGLLTLAVEQGYRGRGIGEQVLRALIDRARTAKLSALNLSVMNNNPNAIRLYERLGFATESYSPHLLLRRMSLLIA